MNDPYYNPYGSPGSQHGGPNFGPPPPAQEERVMATLAHASILLPHAGLLVPLVLWLIHSGRPDRAYAAFQAKQAFVFHLSAVALQWLAAFACFVLGFFSLGLGWLLLIPIVGLGHLAAIIMGLIGAVDSFNGRDFRYPVIGSMLSP